MYSLRTSYPHELLFSHCSIQDEELITGYTRLSYQRRVVTVSHKGGVFYGFCKKNAG